MELYHNLGEKMHESRRFYQSRCLIENCYEVVNDSDFLRSKGTVKHVSEMVAQGIASDRV